MKRLKSKAVGYKEKLKWTEQFIEKMELKEKNKQENLA